MNLAPYRKAIAAVLAAIVICLQSFAGIGDGATLFGLPLDAATNTVVALIGAGSVYWLNNTPAKP